MQRLSPLTLCLLAGMFSVASPSGAAARGAGVSGAAAHTARADAPRGSGSGAQSAPRAPSGPPLVATPTSQSEPTEGAGPSSPAGEADPLVSNGLGSPSCRSRLTAELAPAGRRNCETSGFVASAAPTGGYGVDVHIDTGVFGLSSGGLLSAVQDLLVAPVWMALVWIVHAVIVMLEWCFTLDLLAGDGGLGSGLASAQRHLTGPWLPLALAIASLLLVYDGLVRRRVAESLGQALAVVAMICGGLWLMLNPSGTVGTLSGWANQAGLGTLAVAVRGTPVAPAEALGVAMDGVFAATIEGPWCYLEFGDVRWCRDPESLDRALKEAGLKIAAEELAQGGGGGGGAVRHSARLLREARTNGALFLALPSNGPQRNSINSQGSLLRALCRTDEATNCSGATAAQAEFRTNSGTWARVGGLLLIAVGVLGMVMLLGHLGLRLLMAAMLSLFYLLLAPGVVLAPALGERGRALFRAWAARLFGAVLSKLVFAFLLGVVLAVMAVVESLEALGWWTQWLLLAAFWWGVFFRRHQLLGGAAGFLPGVERHARAPIGRRAADALDGPLRVRRALASRRRDQRSPGTAGLARHGRSPALSASGGVSDPQADAMPGRKRRGRCDAEVVTRLDESRGQLARIIRAHSEAASAGDRRRAARLEVRRDRVAGEIALGEAAEVERAARRPEQHAGLGARQPGGQEHSIFLDAQTALPPRGLRDDSGRRRDYEALAALAGMTRAQYGGLAPGARRAARLEIDQELAARRAGAPPASPASAAAQSRTPQPGADATGGPTRAPRAAPAGVPRAARRNEEPESEVMRDAREVEAGRKRQLGIGRP